MIHICRDVVANELTRWRWRCATVGQDGQVPHIAEYQQPAYTGWWSWPAENPLQDVSVSYIRESEGIPLKLFSRHLAVREHMMDHILEQSPISRPRTPSNFALPSSVTSSSNDNPSERRPSAVSDVVNPLTGLPGATIRSRHASMSSGPTSPVQTMHERENSREKESSIPSPGVPLPRTATPGLILTMSSPEVLTGRLPSETLPANPLHSKPSPSPSTDTPRQLQSAEQLASRLPPHLQALRTTSLGMSGLPSPFQSSPAASPERDSSPRSPIYAFPPAGGVSRKMSLLAMTPSEGSRNQSRSGSAEHSSTNTPAGPPILVNPKCSGYFVEPVSLGSSWPSDHS